MKILLKTISPKIRELGFKGSGQNYYKIDSDVVMVINFQKSSGGEQFYINIGVQPLIMLGEESEPKKIKEYNCMFSDRIKPPNNESGWKYDLSSKELEDLITKIEHTYTHYFDLLRYIRSAIESKSINELLQEAGKVTIYGELAHAEISQYWHNIMGKT